MASFLVGGIEGRGGILVSGFGWGCVGAERNSDGGGWN